MTTFVSVGNARQPFHRLLDGVLAIAASLPQPVIVQHGHTPFSQKGVTAIDFMDSEEFARRLGGAQLVIIHAGAGSIMHAIEAGKVPVVMPRRADRGEHVNDHQVELAEALGIVGKVVVADEPKDLVAGIATALARQKEREGAGNGPSQTEEPRMLNLVRDVLAEYARGAGK